ncbi:Protein K01C8.2 [Aphelenchoides avenae]|nr:Protein K01C8.2 [Aphelenchus avenae]
MPRLICPSQQTIYMIFCSPTDINVCPSDARCLQAQNRPQSYICCRSCSQQGYTCQLSQVLMNWVCCGQPQRTARCADGRETYTQEIGRTFTCNPLVFPGMCPNGYECSFSDQPGINVCCRAAQPPNPGTDVTFRPPVDELTCPLGWSAYEDNNGAHHFCQSATDMSCPQGFSCAQSSVAGIFICCRLASNLKCQNNLVTLLVNNNPRLCTMNNFNSCPRGYSCQQSTVAQVNICCGQSSSTSGELLCRDGQIPAYVGPNVRYCSRLGQPDTCPPSYICSPSNRVGMNVCCHYFPPTRRTHIRLHSGQVTNVCGETAAPFLDREGVPVECSDDPSACPADFDCQPSMTNTKMYCCQEAACPGPSSYGGGGLGRKCSNDDDCQAMLECMQSPNLPGHECSSYTTNGESICCQSYLELDNACPENRDPYRDSTTDEYAYCDVGNTECPNGFLCKHNIHSGRRICCSPIAFCPNGRVPLIDSLTQQAKRPECN